MSIGPGSGSARGEDAARGPTIGRRTVLVGLAAAGATYVARELEIGGLRGRLADAEREVGGLRGRLADAEREAAGLRERAAALSYNVATGGGVNRKLMRDPATGEPRVPLDEVFSFDRNHAMCRVDTNPAAFRMPTHELGEVVIEPHRFFMAMSATTIEQFTVRTAADGTRHVLMKGGLSCATEVGQARTTLGSRTAAEHASYEVEAVDGGVGGGKAGDRFGFTAFFDRAEAPVNFAIFGPKVTFTGEMIEGEITITDPERR